jgi:hypothetical protein
MAPRSVASVRKEFEGASVEKFNFCGYPIVGSVVEVWAEYEEDEPRCRVEWEDATEEEVSWREVKAMLVPEGESEEDLDGDHVQAPARGGGKKRARSRVSAKKLVPCVVAEVEGDENHDAQRLNVDPSKLNRLLKMASSMANPGTPVSVKRSLARAGQSVALFAGQAFSFRAADKRAWHGTWVHVGGAAVRT